MLFLWDFKILINFFSTEFAVDFSFICIQFCVLRGVLSTIRTTIKLPFQWYMTYHNYMGNAPPIAI